MSAPVWPFGDLRPFGYGAIIVDPPWSYEMWGEGGYKKSPEAHYATMSDDAICQLPVGHLAGGDCLLWLWAIWPKMPLAIEAMRAWGFAYKTGGSWTKTTVTGKPAFGTGYIFRSACEPFLIGTIGRPRIGSRSVRNIIESPRRLHSQKPPEARVMVQQLRPDARCAELFGIEAWDGHKVWNPMPHRAAAE